MTAGFLFLVGEDLRKPPKELFHKGKEEKRPRELCSKRPVVEALADVYQF